MNDARAIYEFGDFALDVGRQRLLPRAGGEGVALTGKALDTLVYLVEHAGEPLERDALLRAIWPDVIVEENSLTQTVSGLRRLLGETRGENRYIATLPRKGYRFVASVSVRMAEPTSPAIAPPSRRRRATLGTFAIGVSLAAVAVVMGVRAARDVSPAAADIHAETPSAEAFAQFANGRVAYLRLTEPSLLQAIAYFEQAVALDPRYARAYAGIADSHVLLAVLGARSPALVYPKARAAAEKALALDPSLAAAHVSLGQIEMVHDHDLAGAAHELQRAVQLDSKYAPAYFYLGALEAMRGDASASLAAYDRAMQIDPYTLPIRAGRALALLHARRIDDSIDALRQVLALDERFDLARAFLMRALLAKGEFAQVAAEMRARSLHAPGAFGFLGQALALAGRGEEARAELERVLTLSRSQHVPAYDIATIYAALGDADNTFLWLDRALDDSSPIGTVPLEPLFDWLHADPRFERLVSRIRGPRT